jgi:phage-related protein (TIGR01555 family)
MQSIKRRDSFKNAQQATREGWEYNVKTFGDNEEKNKAVAEAIKKRDDDLKMIPKYREMIKYARIYAKGIMSYISVNGDLVKKPEQFKDTKNQAMPIPDLFKSIDYINVITDPEQYYIEIINSYDATVEDYNQPTFYISGNPTDPSRIIYHVNDFDPQTQEGISVVQNILEISDALDGAVMGTKNILERLGAVIVKSKHLQLSENTRGTITEILNGIKYNLKNASILGLPPESDVDLMNFQFAGLNTAYEFIFDIMSMITEVPKSVLIGSSKANMITGEGEKGSLENYYDRIRSFQENQLQFVIRRIVDLYSRETSGAVYKALGGKELIYDIDFNPLVRPSAREDAEVSKIKSERDKLDVDMGKITGIEAGELDPRVSHLMDEDVTNDPEDDTKNDDRGGVE